MQKQVLHHEELTQAIKDGQVFCLIGHEFIDGDALGGMLGLGTLLENMGKTVFYLTTHLPSSVFSFLEDVNKISIDCDISHRFDYIIFVDFSPLSRIKILADKYADYFLSHRVIIIDHHHEENPLDVFLYHKDISSIATCEIIAERAFASFDHMIDQRVATYLLMGIMTDSGNFLFPADYQRTFGIVIKLLAKGAKKDFLTTMLFRSREWGSIEFLQILLGRAKKLGSFAWTWTENNEREQYGIDKQEAKSALNMIQSVKGVGCALLLDILPHKWKIHLRSKDCADGIIPVDCHRVCNFFGGGGHRFASGATIDPYQKFIYGDESICPAVAGVNAFVGFVKKISEGVKIEKSSL